MKDKVIVVGAGIVGSSIALSLCKRGFQPIVVEADDRPAGATAVATGHVVVMDDSPAELALTEYGRWLWQNSHLPDTCDFRRCGTLWVAEDDEEMAVAEHKRRSYVSVGVEARLLNADELAELEPCLRGGLAGGLFVPDDCVVSPASSAAFFLEQAREVGADIVPEHTAVSTGAKSVTLDDGRVIRADHVVVAAGLTSRSLCPELKLFGRKGYLVQTDDTTDLCSHQVLELGYIKSSHDFERPSVAFNIQPRRGRFILGSSRENNETAEVDREVLNLMMARAFRFMPVLEGLEWSDPVIGIRPASPDKLPYIGQLDNGVWVGAGHEGIGITSSIATGELLADMIAGMTPRIDPAPYSPSRINSAQ